MKQNSLTQNSRRHEISFLNVLLCFTVIFIHIVSYAVTGFAVGTLKYTIAMYLWRLSSFAVQGFILLAGVKFFLTKKDRVPYGKYMLSRLKAIGVPYIVLFVVYYCFYYVVYDYPLDIKFILKMFFSGSLVCHLYFIPLILQFDVLSPIWKKLVGKVSGIIVIPFCLILGQILEVNLPYMLNGIFKDFNFIYNDRIFTTYLVYWVAGCYIGKNYDEFLKFLKENFTAVSVALAICLGIFGYYTYLSFNNIMYVPFMNQLHSFYVICELCFLYCVAVKFGSAVIEKSKLLRQIDKASYSIYLWHMLALFGANFVLEYMGIMLQGIAFAVRVVLIYPVTILWSILITKLRKKINF